MRIRTPNALAALTLGLMLALPAQAAPAYTVTILPGPGGERTWAWGINDSGHVVGSLETDGGDRAFLYQNGTMTDLGTIPGPSGEEAFSIAYGINNIGQVVGSSSAMPGNPRAFLYQNGTMTNLGTIPGGENGLSVAYGINNIGQVVGGSSTAHNANLSSFLYQNGAMNLVSGTAPQSVEVAIDINDFGQVVMPGGIYQDGVRINSIVDGIGLGLNDIGQAVGYGSVSGYDSYRAMFFSQDGTSMDLGFYGFAREINNSGQVVGLAGIDGIGQRGFIYQRGSMTDLTSLIDPVLGMTIIDATDINASGQIAAIGDYGGNHFVALLLTPVPEPETYALMLAGLGLLGFVARRRKQKAVA